MVCFIVAKMCEGLDYAHASATPRGQELHIVLRDVSPQNCLVSFEGEIRSSTSASQGRQQGHQDPAGILKGKFGYMSPEQVRPAWNSAPTSSPPAVVLYGCYWRAPLRGRQGLLGDRGRCAVDILPHLYNRPSRGPREDRHEGLAKDAEDRYTWRATGDALQASSSPASHLLRKDLAQYM
jgi:serine/threonine protein kinase